MLVLIHTAYAAYQDRFMTWGAQEYLLKSSDLTTFKATVRRLLGSLSIRWDLSIESRGFQAPERGPWSNG
jgi:hypothetical protein